MLTLTTTRTAGLLLEGVREVGAGVAVGIGRMGVGVRAGGGGAEVEVEVEAAGEAAVEAAGEAAVIWMMMRGGIIASSGTRTEILRISLSLALRYGRVCVFWSVYVLERRWKWGDDGVLRF